MLPVAWPNWPNATLAVTEPTSPASPPRPHVATPVDPPVLDLSRPARLHVVGIGGAGMSAIATVLAAMGHRVSGSDLKTSASLERLRALGVIVSVGHDAANVDETIDAVTVSTAIPADNPEVVAARERGIPVLRRAEALAAIAATRRAVTIAGTHGKTTTSSMLTLVLIEAGLRPRSSSVERSTRSVPVPPGTTAPCW